MSEPINQAFSRGRITILYTASLVAITGADMLLYPNDLFS
jgi:hypothetical protein